MNNDTSLADATCQCCAHKRAYNQAGNILSRQVARLLQILSRLLEKNIEKQILHSPRDPIHEEKLTVGCDTVIKNIAHG